MVNKDQTKKTLEKQGHRFVGNHSSVKICRWTKKSLVNEGECYKQRFYGIRSHRCCQMSPCLECQNKCLHCWRPIEFDFKLNREIDEPKDIIEKSIKSQQKLLNGFKGNKKINMKKFREAQEPMQFAISLTGEPTLYPKLGELTKELRKQGKTSFLVTNGLCPDVLKKMNKDNCLPTQLYISLNAPNEKLYWQWHRSSDKNAWKKFNESLELMNELKTRRVIRMTLVKDLNMNDDMIKDYVRLIKKAMPDFIEVKGYKAVGFARNRSGMGYEVMPTHKEIKEYARKIAEELKYQIEDEFEPSCVVLLKRDSLVRRFIS